MGRTATIGMDIRMRLFCSVLGRLWTDCLIETLLGLEPQAGNREHSEWWRRLYEEKGQSFSGHKGNSNGSNWEFYCSSSGIGLGIHCLFERSLLRMRILSVCRGLGLAIPRESISRGKSSHWH